MLFDASGMVLAKHSRLLPLPPIPDTGWTPPREFPNLSAATVMSFDVETKELDFDHGPGWARGKSSIVGFSVAVRDRLHNRGSWYFPVRHEVGTEHNIDPTHAFNWLREQLHTPLIPKVGANLIFDVGCLTEEKIFVEGPLYDVQFAEALLNEDGYVSLDHLGAKYLRAGKESSALYEWCSRAYGGSVDSDRQRGNIWRAPPVLVGPYGEADASMPIDILEHQWSLLEREGLLDVFEMENKLIRLLVKMRMRGIKVDVPGAHALYDELAGDIKALYIKLFELVPIHVNVNSPGDLVKLFDAAGIPYPRTKEGNPSFRKDFLKAIEHPVTDLVLAIREIEKVSSTFIRSYIIESSINGVIHCNFHPLRGDDEGTRSGRFSSDYPNLQNIPVRSLVGKRVRKLFLAFHQKFRKIDYSQIEYRLLAHFAVGPGSDEVRRQYNEDPKTDFHVLTQNLVLEIAKLMIERKPIKNINFGLLYGMGEPKLARQIGIVIEKAKEIFAAYHKGNPYVKATMQATSKEAKDFGYVTTIMGRRSRFDMFSPVWSKDAERQMGLPFEQALEVYGTKIERAYTHKAINRRLQGSAADMIKKGMVQADEAGIFDVIGVPLLQVHDELDQDVIDESPRQNEAFKELYRILETAIPLRVPVRIDYADAVTWGDIQE